MIPHQLWRQLATALTVDLATVHHWRYQPAAPATPDLEAWLGWLATWKPATALQTDAIRAAAMRHLAYVHELDEAAWSVAATLPHLRDEDLVAIVRILVDVPRRVADRLATGESSPPAADEGRN